MSRVDDLIAELCPHGVEYKKLSSLGIRNKGTAITAAKMKLLSRQPGPVRVFAGGQTIADVREDAIPEKDIIRVPSIIVKSRGYIGFDFYENPFAHKSELWSYSINNVHVEQKFVYYYLLTQVPKLQKLARATSVKIPQLSVRDTDLLDIPVPPLEVQREIVQILDKFTKLEAELEARHKQYEYYRNQLLTFNPTHNLITDLYPNGVEYRRVGDVAQVGTGSSDRKDATENGEFPFYVRSKEIMRIGSYQFDEEAIIIPGEGGIGDIFHYASGRYALHQRAYRISFQTNDINTKFAYYYFIANFKAFILSKAVSATVISIRKQMIMDFRIPVPPLEEQHRIVEILDKFDTLVNNLTIGLPAEINARHKQYEHYRNKLLTFKQQTT